jgi:hypothetical protein
VWHVTQRREPGARRPEALTAIGIGGLIVLVWLMVMKPA